MSASFDVLIVGAGISGIGAAHYLREGHPQRSFAILEARDSIGGTWDLFRYPGIRSDSDLYTFGYEFKPWTGDSIATGPAIMRYLQSVVDSEGLAEYIRYHHKVVDAAWSTPDARWTLDVERSDTGERIQVTCKWLFLASGYYRYDQGHTPHFEGRERFAGPIVHPQFWPEDLDVSGQRVVVIGSGATAVTLVPALAASAKHVTMLQRTPTYVLPVPTVDRLAGRLQRWFGPERGHRMARAKNVWTQRTVWSLSKRHPDRVRKFIRWVNVRSLPPGYPVDVHFKPPYDPWDQRLCAVPDSDLFRAIADGSVDVVTDHVETFTEDGIRLRSGRELPADVIVTATGFELQPMGGATLSVDGEPVDPGRRIAYKGMMLSGVPNFVYAVGYTNASWTLKIGPLCRHLNALLAHMDARSYDVCRPEPADPAMPTKPYLEFGAGYIRRAQHLVPRQGDRWPWLTPTDYVKDRRLLSADRVADPELHFSRARTARPAGEEQGSQASSVSPT